MNIKLTSFPLFLLFTFVYASVCLSIDEGNLNYSSTEDMYGFQFTHDECAEGAAGGAAEAAGWMISASSTVALGFSLTGVTIPAGNGILIEGVNCDTITDIVISGEPDENSSPPEVDVQLTDDCSLNITNNHSPIEYQINNVYPNPFNPICNVNYSISSYGHVTISLFNIQGRKLLTPINQMMTPGNYNITIDGNELTSGVYFISIIYNGNELKQKISLVK